MSIISTLVQSGINKKLKHIWQIFKLDFLGNETSYEKISQLYHQKNQPIVPPIAPPVTDYLEYYIRNLLYRDLPTRNISELTIDKTVTFALRYLVFEEK